MCQSIFLRNLEHEKERFKHLSYFKREVQPHIFTSIHKHEDALKPCTFNSFLNSGIPVVDYKSATQFISASIWKSSSMDLLELHIGNTRD